MKRLMTFLLILLLGWAINQTAAQRKVANEQTKQLQPSKDATLIESSKGVLGNSEGQSIFVGRTGQPEGSERRGLIAFDFAGAIPPRSRILSVTLTMTVQISAGGDQPSTIGLYRVSRFWKEGTSVGQGGRGADAQAGDATWIHSVYPTTRWSTPGGDYLKAVSAKTEVRGAGVYTWNSTPKLVADVQSWVNSPKKNFGWILIGDESKGATARVFYSRESTEETTRPQLTVTFRPPSK
ncbi:MAG TPA: DNRLRE domain-containing protein [Pyrinomonadaceae bacterium]|nr:DNRLRE domain-containing protein [Pyrinomonadaceae bacterium]